MFGKTLQGHIYHLNFKDHLQRCNGGTSEEILQIPPPTVATPHTE